MCNPVVKAESIKGKIHLKQFSTHTRMHMDFSVYSIILVDIQISGQAK